MFKYSTLSLVVRSLLLSSMLFVGIVCGLFCLAVCDSHSISYCSSNEFPCDDGSCIEKSFWCDSEVHCPDMSDEKYCRTSSSLFPDPNKCKETYFLCKDGPCIPLVGRCDGYSSCFDNSDEHECGLTVNALNETDVTSMQTNLVMNPIPNSTELPVVTSTIVDMISENITEFHVTTSKVLNVISGSASEPEHENDVEDDLQADVDSGKSPKLKNETLEHGFLEVNSKAFRHERAMAQEWLLKSRDSNFGWGRETARALTALYMSDDDLLRKYSDEKMLMSKQLHLQIFTALIRNRTTVMPIGDLALFINALSASCDNPRNFYGQDLVNVLRQRTDAAQQLSKLVTPLVYLTLCLNNATTFTDVRKVQEILYGAEKVDKVDMEALVSLAATCISGLPKFASYSTGKQVAARMFQKIAHNGLPENIYQLSLVAQALNEAHINQDLWNRSQVLQMIFSRQDDNGSFGDILATYYAVPILSGKSLLSLRSNCDIEQHEGLTPLEVLKNGNEEKIYVRYSLYFGNPVEVSQTVMIKVKKMTSFLDIMRIAGTVNSIYEFKYDMSSGKPTVYSVGGVVNDPERGLYWRLHVTSQQNSTDDKTLLPYDGDIRSFMPKSEDFIVFWMKELF